MTLPKRPPISEPIPNSNIPNVPEQYTVKAPYWDAVVSGNLSVSADGSLELTTGEGDGNPNVTVLGPYWHMPLGAGLDINENGELVPGSPLLLSSLP